MLSRFNEFTTRKINEFGDRFDPSDLSPKFVPYYNEQWRIEVETPEHGTVRGRVGVTTGWKPSFLLVYSTRHRGSRIKLNDNCKVVRIISYRKP